MSLTSSCCITFFFFFFLFQLNADAAGSALPSRPGEAVGMLSSVPPAGGGCLGGP